MNRRGLPLEFLPTILLTVAVGCALCYLRLVPVPGEPVAAIYRPGTSLPAAMARLAGGWRVLGIAAALPLPVLLLRAAPSASGAATDTPPGAWLLLRASGAGQCGLPPKQRT
jgi:hypothetical protein